MRRLCAAGLAAVLLAALAVTVGSSALAYFSGEGSGSASAAVTKLTAPTISAATPAAGGTVTLTWGAVTPPGAGSVTYSVTRDGGNPAGTCPDRRRSDHGDHLQRQRRRGRRTHLQGDRALGDMVGRGSCQNRERDDRRNDQIHDLRQHRDPDRRGLGQSHDHRQRRQQQHRHDLHGLALAGLLRRLLEPGEQRPHRRQQLWHRGRLRHRHPARLHRRRRHHQARPKTAC